MFAYSFLEIQETRPDPNASPWLTLLLFKNNRLLPYDTWTKRMIQFFLYSIILRHISYSIMI